MSIIGMEQYGQENHKNYKNKFILKLLNWGDADDNIYDENNKFIIPEAVKYQSEMLTLV